MEIKIDYNKLVKSQNDNGEETSIDLAIGTFHKLLNDKKLPEEAVAKYEGFFSTMRTRGANTVEQALRQYLADYLTDGRVGNEEYAEQQQIANNFFDFVEHYLPNVYYYDIDFGPCHFPKFTDIKANYDWSAVLDLIQPQVLTDKSMFTQAKFHLESYLYYIFDNKTYDEEIDRRMPFITFSEYLHYSFENKRKDEQQ